MDALSFFNSLSEEQCSLDLMKCCGSKRWVHEMVKLRPFSTPLKLQEEAIRVWRTSLAEADYLEAFSHHPKIGAKVQNQSHSSNWSKQEQAGVEQASEVSKRELFDLNIEYENKFGFIYLVFATGKTSEELLMILKSRVKNTRDLELKNACHEHEKITELRINKLLQSYTTTQGI